MAIQTQQITKYVRDTEYNIIRSDKSISGVWSFAVDTGNLFLTYQGSLLQWNPRTTRLSDYTIGNNTYKCQPIAHVDASDTSTLKNQNFQIPDNGQSVAEVSCINAGGASVFEQQVGSKTPVFRQNQLGTNLHSLRFSNGAFMNSDSVFNTVTYTGGFTVFMVLRFLPSFLNFDRYGKTDTTQGTNEWVKDGMSPTQTFNCGLFHGTVSQKYTQYSTNIGAGMRWNSTNNSWRVEPGVSGNYLDNRDNQEGDFENSMWSSYINPLENYNLNAFDDTIILCWEFPDTTEKPRGGHFVRVSTCGKAKFVDKNVSYPALLKGLSIGQYNSWFTGNGGHFDLGEMIVFNNAFTRSSLNEIGTHLATKWNTLWVNFE